MFLQKSSESAKSTSEEGQPCVDTREIEEEIAAAFSPEAAHNAYVPFTRLMGQFHMARILGEDHDVIWHLSSQYENALSKHNLKDIDHKVHRL